MINMKIKPGDKFMLSLYGGKLHFEVVSIKKQDPPYFDEVIGNTCCGDELLKQDDCILLPQFLSFVETGVLKKIENSTMEKK